MLRIFALLVILAIASVFGSTVPQLETSDEAQLDLEALKQQRVQLLEDRVAAIKKWVDLERADLSELIRPEMDVINAQLDYAQSNVNRKQLLKKLMSKYKALIELAELRIARPTRPDANNLNEQMVAESELFFLKSELIRIQVVHDSLK